ncbi:MAG: hypothetical protein K2K40_07000 [Paramuribaculum sp.]|nr:hypothetical protein [Paramuribaculum sp.]
MNKILATICALTLSTLVASAASPFREHRYDEFRATPVGSDAIVFFGNSITHMHNWAEAFGDDPRVINRGNSGGMTDELLDNVESIIAGRPAKLFLLIGTNDLGHKELTPASTAGNIRYILERIRQESPSTELFVTGILPSRNGNRTPERIDSANVLIRHACSDMGVTYIDMSEMLRDIPSDRTLSYDGLHITAKGYYRWCNAIAPLAGLTCTYPDPATAEYDNAGIDSNSYGMRATYWSVDSVGPDDTLIIGNTNIHSGEWRELLGTTKVKDRGTSWGWNGFRIPQWSKAMGAILDANPSRKSAPRRIMLNVGDIEVTDTAVSIAQMQADCLDLIRRIRSSAPTTEITLLSIFPSANTDLNRIRIVAANDMLRALADADSGVNYIDLYTPLTAADGITADPRYVAEGDYILAPGYNRIAQIIAPKVGGHALTTEEFEAHYALIMARTALGREVMKARRSRLTPEGAAMIGEAMTLLAGNPAKAELDAMTSRIKSLTD